jgi:hypothetical protein
VPAVAAIVAFGAPPVAEDTAAVVAAAAAAAAVAFVAPEDTPASNQTALNCVVDKLQLATRCRTAQQLRATRVHTHVVEDKAGTHLLWGTGQTVQLPLLPELLWLL